MKKYIFSWSYYNLGDEVVFAETEEKAREIFSERARYGKLSSEEFVMPEVQSVKVEDCEKGGQQ